MSYSDLDKKFRKSMAVHNRASEILDADDSLSEIVDAVEKTFNPDVVKFAIMNSVQAFGNIGVLSAAMSHPDIQEKISALIYDSALMVLATEIAMSE